MSIVLELDNVTRSYGSGPTTVHALREVSLSVERGEFVAVMGPSGSGKSTLLALAGGLDQPTGGGVGVAGTELKGRTRDELARIRRRMLGFVFQDFNLVPTLTVLENVALPLELDDARTADALQQARHALERVGIAELADRGIDQVSGGQRQRVAIARAIIGDRRILLADEPTGALDTSTGDQIMALLRQLADEGVAVVMVTHEARHAGWADRVIFLRDGRLVDESRSDDPTVLLRHSNSRVPRRIFDPDVEA
ncbi:ABC transporter ATP-binding protein [Aestuariimicrobium ganziense]|uniref:ABC transporter ATP-binding protein n=1 Tax=Aestuariimicrobium ganziense TaxID=2773677 RepID=UPI00194261B9|nr:ABC transporter ATP-binding protein [Aestuariimicrobium ganziense]